MRCVKCDKCGCEIRTDDEQNATFPTFRIQKIDSVYSSHMIDLCSSCKKEFIAWLGKGRAKEVYEYENDDKED